jgi:amidase
MHATSVPRYTRPHFTPGDWNLSTELWRLGASELAAAIRNKDVKSREVVEAHLARIAAVNPRLNAITVTLADSALAAADVADAATASGATTGPLHGVPMTVKENIDLAGSATTQGIVAMAEAVPPLDAPHIRQLRAAGAIPIGRTNLPDFGMRWHTDNALRGATKNPWNANVTPGGSSGGDAAALASGMTPLGMGNDYGGSLRWPSQCCGTAALRPTFGRVASASSLPGPEMPLTIQLFAVQGPMARHVRDVRLALEAMTAPDPRDPWYMPVPMRGPDVPKRVAMTIDPGGRGVDPAVAEGLHKAAAALRDAGYTVEEVEPPMVNEALALWASLVHTELKMTLVPVLEQIASADALRFLECSFEVVRLLDYPGYIEGFGGRNGIARAWSEFQARYPLVLGPVATIQPFEPGYDTRDAASVGKVLEGVRFVVLCNLLGLPAAVVPVGTSGGLPQAVQLIGARYREDLCLDAAEAIEDRLGVLTPIDPM